MLTKDELVHFEFPTISLSELKEERVIQEYKPNLIRKAILNGENRLNLYLPINMPLYKKEYGKRTLYDSESIQAKKDKLTIIRNQLNSFSHKPILYKRKIHKDDRMAAIIQSIKEHKNKLEEMEENNQKNLERLVKINGGSADKPFNLQQLIKKVRNIVKGVDNLKSKNNNKFEVANIYKEHAISKKKNSRPVDDFYELEKSRDFLFLQKLILNLEYENIVNRNLKKKNKDILYIANNYEEDDFKDDLLLNNKTINLCSNTVLSKNDLYKKINKICSTKISRNNSSTKRDYDNEDLISKQRHFEKDLLERRNIKFFHRYKNYMKNIKKEENRHYTLKIFNKKSIDQIIKSKNDLELDKLKYDYSNKIGSIEAKTISGHTKHIRSKNKFEIKHKKYNSMNKKIKTALFNNEIGKLETQKYNIEDFIEL